MGLLWSSSQEMKWGLKTRTCLEICNVTYKTWQLVTRLNSRSLLTDTVNEQFRFCREIKVDNDIEHRDVDATRCQVSNHKYSSHLVTKLCNSDLACRWVERTVGI